MVVHFTTNCSFHHVTPSRIPALWLGIDGQLWHAYRVGGGSWSAPASLGMGTLGSEPWATYQTSGAIDVF